jgi:hypothetical protein
MSELIEQLRFEAKHDTNYARAAKLITAANRIAALETEVERLRSLLHAVATETVVNSRWPSFATIMAIENELDTER